MSTSTNNDIGYSLSKNQVNKLEFFAIGTKWIIDFETENNSDIISEKILERVELFENCYSRFRDNSIISKIAKNPGTYTLPEDAKKMFDLCEEFYKISNGFFTPLIGKTLVEAGYDKDYSLQPKIVNQTPAWEDCIEYVYPNLIIKKPIQLDFGAIGKGYIIDIISELLQINGINNFCIDAGGDISYQNKNNKPLRVGLENPNNREQVIGVISLLNQSICASSGSRRHWANFHHIINPKTSTSPTDIIAVWVVAKNTILADGLTTCLFFVEPEKLTPNFEFEYLILNSDFSIKKSPNFKAELFVK